MGTRWRGSTVAGCSSSAAGIGRTRPARLLLEGGGALMPASCCAGGIAGLAVASGCPCASSPTAPMAQPPAGPVAAGVCSSSLPTGACCSGSELLPPVAACSAVAAGAASAPACPAGAPRISAIASELRAHTPRMKARLTSPSRAARAACAAASAASVSSSRCAGERWVGGRALAGVSGQGGRLAAGTAGASTGTPPPTHLRLLGDGGAGLCQDALPLRVQGRRRLRLDLRLGRDARQGGKVGAC